MHQLEVCIESPLAWILQVGDSKFCFPAASCMSGRGNPELESKHSSKPKDNYCLYP
ncbi:unnamed protein product [Penicillium camemberti]|uniref:Str. FM013 n=1 Tax=Penicillium camemberti (strain FM 013) TaxID=1429867 RepID=A0A0G4P1N7_PENC3|nr:unnamed protein product [Penicillium camemberti]